MKSMKILDEVFVKVFTVEFGPGEEDELMKKFGHCRCAHMGPAKNYKKRKPWGLREATFQEPLNRKYFKKCFTS